MDFVSSVSCIKEFSFLVQLFSFARSVIFERQRYARENFRWHDENLKEKG